MDKKQQIIKLWKQTKQVHPSYAEIAKKVAVNKSYVWRIIKDWQMEKRPSNGRIKEKIYEQQRKLV